MSVQEAARQLRVLKKSLEEADRRDVKPKPDELWLLTHIAFDLGTAGYRVFPAYWHERERDSANYPYAFQVLFQVNSLIDILAAPKKTPPQSGRNVIDQGVSPDEALPHLHALKMSFDEADRRKLLPNLRELENFRHLVVSLHIAGYEAIVSLPSADNPKSPSYPKAFQVLIQVESLIDSLEGTQSYPSSVNKPQIEKDQKQLD